MRDGVLKTRRVAAAQERLAQALEGLLAKLVTPNAAPTVEGHQDDSGVL